MEIEDVLAVFKKLVRDEHVAKLSDLGPEDRMMPVLNVEIVVFHEGEYFAGELNEPIERFPVLIRGQQRAVLCRDSGASL